MLAAACGGSSATGEDAGAADAAQEDAAPPPPYEQVVLDRAHIGSDSSQPDFQLASADVAPADAPFAKVTLVLDLESPCYPFSKWHDDPPPSGQNWPASCDAFDRNFETSLRDPAAPEGTPAVELVRAITPFGGPLHVEADVTDVFNAVAGPRALDVRITTWSDGAGLVSGSAGGWYVSAKLVVVPGAPPRRVLGVTPLQYFDHGSETVPADLPFSLPEGTTSVRIEHRVTGHGGASDHSPRCIGPAEEFCARDQRVYLDGVLLEALLPWRDDCATLCTLTTDPGQTFEYCLENPCGDPRSVRASRANWCPGSETPPFAFSPPTLAAGEHTFRSEIDGVAPGGSWRTSTVVYAFGD